MLPVNRRDFLLGTAAAGALSLASCHSTARRPGPNDRLRVAQIGCGGKGYSDMQAVARQHDIVALCDVDEERAQHARSEHPTAPFYHDYRDLFDRELLDAVLVSTADHSHALPALIAMQLGCHVFVQKPLTHTVEEARLLLAAARRYGSITSMGNQGTCFDGFRRAAATVRAGAIGQVHEVHVWTNRPIWPQGIARPAHIDAIPASLRWNLWLGPAPYRPYASGKQGTGFSGYTPFNWRGWWDFGTGALGDMACHMANLAFYSLELGAPDWVEADQVGETAETAPNQSTVRFHFAARGDRVPVTLTWYDGGRLPPLEKLPDQSQRRELRDPKHGGFILIGETGQLYSPTDYGESFELFPRHRYTDYQLPVTARSPGIYQEWLDGIFSGTQPAAGFEYAAPFTEAILLGNVALRTGKRIEYDADSGTAPGCPEAEQFLRKQYRRGFELPQI